ncbi:MAG TPA: hypothetical protein K8W01_17780 [Methylorubrum populi]|uniref:Uncharacterized protein n=1 Tax=Methylorubrum populi TaxID=223967 RepID=A0A921E582_9HYPH|nr:hypothetical protein [Methylorubrum populi]
MSPDLKKPKRSSGLRQVKKPARKGRLLASSKLSDAKIREVIRCYAFARSPAEAIARTGLSHVTVYRLYGHIRRRLLYVGLYRAKTAFIDDMNDWEEEGRPHFDWEDFEKALRLWLGNRRGIDAKNRDLYVSEAVFRVQENRYEPLQIYNLILQAIKSVGPLNREPEPTAAALYYREVLRLNMQIFLSVARTLGDPVFNAFAESKTDTMISRMDPSFSEAAAFDRRVISKARKT